MASSSTSQCQHRTCVRGGPKGCHGVCRRSSAAHPEPRAGQQVRGLEKEAELARSRCAFIILDRGCNGPLSTRRGLPAVGHAAMQLPAAVAALLGSLLLGTGQRRTEMFGAEQYAQVP